MKKPVKVLRERVRWEVGPAKGWLGWTAVRNSFEQCRFFFKFRAVDFAVATCNDELDRFGLRSELTIKGRDGRIQDKRTYGEDPKEVLG